MLDQGIGSVEVINFGDDRLTKRGTTPVVVTAHVVLRSEGIGFGLDQIGSDGTSTEVVSTKLVEGMQEVKTVTKGLVTEREGVAVQANYQVIDPNLADLQDSVTQLPDKTFGDKEVFNNNPDEAFMPR